MNTNDINDNKVNDDSNFNGNSSNKKKKGGLSNFLPYIFILAILVVVAMLIFPKFFFGDEKTTSNETTNNSNDTKPVEPEKPKSELKIIDTTSKSRPIGIMINCHNEALPQSGLQDAYAVYELMVEGGITRMFALFKDKDFTKVGAVRSVRAQYLAYAFENDAGGSKEATLRLKNENIANINVDSKYG